MSRILIAALFATTLATAATAQTANAPGGAAANTSSAGAAANGTLGPAAIPGVTREQKLVVMEAKARELDTNGDGKLTLEEWQAGGGKQAGFDTMDYNRDGVLTRQEFRSNARKLKAFNDFQAAAPH